MIKIYKYAGLSLIIASCIGFLTVADDFRHTGEFWAVSALLVSGIMLFLASTAFSKPGQLPIQWLALCLLCSLPVGAFIFDNVPLGCLIGLSTGAAVIFLIHGKRTHQPMRKA